MPPEHWFYTVPLRLRSLFFRRRVDQELDEELQDHLEQKTQEYIENGLSPEEAHYAALRDFGNVELSKQNCRDARKTLWIQNLFDDVRFALRMLGKDPTFTVIAVLTLALGIGANTAIFSVVNAVLLRPLPYAKPERLVFLSESTREVPHMFVSLPNFADWQSMNTVFESIGAYRKASVALTGQGEPRRLTLAMVTAGLFPTLGIEPLVGRPFTAADDKAHAERVVMLSDTLWTREFGRDPEVLGKQMRLDGKSYTVIGVIPSSRLPQFWRQMEAFTSFADLQTSVGGPGFRAVHLGVSAYARLKSGVTVQQARAQMRAIALSLEKQYPHTNAGQSITVEPLLDQVVGNVSRPLTLLMGAVALVLLIACANVANLLASRAVVRRREMAVRRALGAGTARLAGQLLCESILLALLGGGVGLVAAYCAVPVLAHRAVSIMPRIEDVSIDRTVLAFTFVISLLTGILFGLLPLLAAYRAAPTEALQDSGRAPSTGLRRVDLRSLLAISELAMALVLLVAAGLTVRSLFRILQADLGLETNGVVTAVLSLPAIPYEKGAQLADFMQQLVQKVTALPGVTAAGFETAQLLGGSQVSFHVEGYPPPEQGQEPYAEFSSVTPGALEAMGVRLLSGRFFSWSDTSNSLPVCIVDDTMAAKYWPGESALGKRLVTEVPTTADGKPIWQTVVGVVHRVRTNGADEQRLVESFIPYAQYQILRRGRLIIRSQQDPALLLPAVRRAMHSLDPDLPLYDVRTLADLVDDSVAARRFSVILLSVFAIIAMTLAAIGVYGVVSYMVTGRTREIALRLVLGAKPWDILRLVFGRGLVVVLIGTVAGIFASLSLTRLLSALLFKISPTDPWTITSVAALLIVVALTACCIPLRKAMSVNPVTTLHRE